MRYQLENIYVRKARKEDDLEKIAQLLYQTDSYIYPYWFENLERCKKELAPLLLKKKFFFCIDHLFVAVNKVDNDIVGLVCVVNRDTDLDYDYSELKAKNERYCFTVVNYIEKLIAEVKESDFAYISNVCVDERCRGMHIGYFMLKYVIGVYKKKIYNEIVLDVLADNPGAIKLYKNMGFEQFTETFKGFNNPRFYKPDVFSMKAELE